MVGVSERALRPLINEQDEDNKANAIQKIRSGVSKGHTMGAGNIERINNGVEEGKVKSGRPVKNSNEKIIERDEEVDISKAIRPVEEAKAKKSVKKQNFK